MALQGARKEYWDKRKHAGCSHFTWAGGNAYLLDTAGTVISTDLKPTARLDFFSLKIEPGPSVEPRRRSFRSTQGKYYTF
jgi:hypothetical protein